MIVFNSAISIVIINVIGLNTQTTNQIIIGNFLKDTTIYYLQKNPKKQHSNFVSANGVKVNG